jgi:hypothetical protein
MYSKLSTYEKSKVVLGEPRLPEFLDFDGKFPVFTARLFRVFKGLQQKCQRRIELRRQGNLRRTVDGV